MGNPKAQEKAPAAPNVCDLVVKRAEELAAAARRAQQNVSKRA